MLSLKGRDPSDWLITVALTAGVWLVAQRLAAVIPEPMVLCLAFLAPMALISRCVPCGVVSLAAVFVAGVLHLIDQAYALLAFVSVGLTFTGLAMARSMSDAAKLAEARKGLARTSARSSAYIRALECAGVPVFLLDQHGAWLSANLAAVHAVGMPEQVELLGRTSTELDQRAAESLMYSASRSSWLAWMESFRATVLSGSALPEGGYEHPIDLYTRDGVRTTYTMRALAGEEGETILVACKVA